MYVIRRGRVLRGQARDDLGLALPEVACFCFVGKACCQVVGSWFLCHCVTPYSLQSPKGFDRSSWKLLFSCPLWSRWRVGCFQKQKHLMHLSWLARTRVRG